MSQSLYLKVAVLLVRADIRLEQRRWQSHIRKQAQHLPFMTDFLLRDIGFDRSGYVLTMHTRPESAKIERRLYHIRRIISSRILT